MQVIVEELLFIIVSKNDYTLDQHKSKSSWRSLKKGLLLVDVNIHLINDPPIIDADGDKHWFRNGLYHRDNDQPAIICANGTKEWVQNGKAHRIGRPAVTFPNGDEEWWQNGKLHNLDGPAVTKIDGIYHYIAWFQNGLRHRLDGPAMISNNTQRWYRDGVQYFP